MPQPKERSVIGEVKSCYNIYGVEVFCAMYVHMHGPECDLASSIHHDCYHNCGVLCIYGHVVS